MVVVEILLCLVGAVLSTAAEQRTAAENPKLVMRFRLMPPEVPVRPSPSTRALLILSVVCLAGAALLQVGLDFWPWFLLFVGVSVVFNLLPRAVVLMQHNRRVRRSSAA